MPSKSTLRLTSQIKDFLKRPFVKASFVKGSYHVFSLETFFQISKRISKKFVIQSDNWISKKNLTSVIRYSVPLNFEASLNNNIYKLTMC